MTTEDQNNSNQSYVQPRFKRSGNGRILAGFIVVVAGMALLLKNSGVDLPGWLFTWQMFLVVLGLFLGAKRQFRSGGWWVPLLIGLVFMTERFIDGFHIDHLFWPVIIILAGVFMMFRPRRPWDGENFKAHWKNRYSDYKAQNGGTGEDVIESVSIFGGSKKVILSKNFKGGDITNIFGGSEINLMQADIQDKAVLEVTQVFGGTKLLVPANWELQTDMVAIFGSIEDKRPVSNERGAENGKTLLIHGTSIFGGIDVRSY